MTKAELIDLMTAKILDGGRRTTAEFVRDLITEMINSYLNSDDGAASDLIMNGKDIILTDKDDNTTKYRVCIRSGSWSFDPV